MFASELIRIITRVLYILNFLSRINWHYINKFIYIRWILNINLFYLYLFNFVCHCGLVVSAPAWDWTGCDFDSWQCWIYIPCSSSLRLLGTLQGFLGAYGLTQKLCLKKEKKFYRTYYKNKCFNLCEYIDYIHKIFRQKSWAELSKS